MERKYMIYATNRITGDRYSVSLGVTKKELIPYLDQEYFLYKHSPSDKGLYGEFRNIVVKRMPKT